MKPMAPNDDLFTPEEVDEQIDWLERRSRTAPPGRRQPPNRELIQRLHHLYETEQADDHSIDAVWQRLRESGSVPAASRRRARPSGPPRQRPSDRRPPRAYAPAAPARRGISTRLLTIAAAVLLVVVVGGLVAGIILVRQHGPVFANQATATPGSATTPGCATKPTATAEAWIPYVTSPDDANGQVMGTINHGPTMTLSDFHYPLYFQSSNNIAVPSFMAWSPDARYLAVGFNAGTVAAVYPYLLDTKTHTTSPLPFPTAGYQLPQPSWPRGRTFAWADSHTLLFFYGGNSSDQGSAGPTYSYDVNTKKLTLMPGVHHAAEGVVRCSTLFYLELTPPKDFLGERNGYNVYQGSALLHRYDLKTNREIGQPITIGPTMKISLAASGGFPTDPEVPTWNVSSDGTLLIYPQEAISVTVLETQRYIVANADGTNARSFVTPRYVPTNTWNMEISPSDQYVLIEGDADIFSMNIDGSNYRAYGNYGATFISINGPAWLPDSSGFDAVNTHQQGQTFAVPYISRYLLSTPPGSDGYVPGTQLVQEVGSLAGLS